MSDTVVVKKNKKKTDFKLLRNLEKNYDEAVEDMEKKVRERPVVEVDETLVEESGYVDPRQEELDWIESAKSKIADTEVKEIIKPSNFGTYQETKSKIEKMKHIYKSDFNVKDEYRKILIHNLKESIGYLTKLLEELE